MGNFDCDEIHDIRVKHSEAIKNLSDKEIIESSKQNSKDAIKLYTLLRQRFLNKEKVA